MKALTQKRLKELLSYDPSTGQFVWLVCRPYKTIAGRVAGSIDAGYALIGIDGSQYRAHRLAWLYMTGEWPEIQIDHINRVRDDNRWVNLRVATNRQNAQNMSFSRANRSGHTGVSWVRRAGKWMAFIGVDNKNVNLGLFTELEDAIAARKAAKAKLHTFDQEQVA